MTTSLPPPASFFKHLQMFFKHLQIMRSGVLDPLDKRQRACPNWRVVEVKELSRVRRRPRPLKQLDQRARIARLALEAEIYRDPVATFSIRVTPAQLQQIEDERRTAAYGSVPSRCALIRMLLSEALMFRRSMRPTPRRSKGVPFVGLD